MAIFNRLVQPNLTAVYTRTYTHTHTQQKGFGVIKYCGSDELRSPHLFCCDTHTHTQNHTYTRDQIHRLSRNWSWI